MAAPAVTPQPPYYAVIFTSVRTDGDNGYGETACRMRELAARQPGFLDRHLRVVLVLARGDQGVEGGRYTPSGAKPCPGLVRDVSGPRLPCRTRIWLLEGRRNEAGLARRT
jgi:hypothetical protein